MSNKIEIQFVGHIYNDYKEKFGIPRQSGLVKSIISKIVFEREFSSPDYFKGIESFTHIWLLWQFSETVGKEITPTVRPPKLGGNEHMGVFATRSPFRPNNIGISSVKLEKVEYNKVNGTILYVSGADLMNGTPWRKYSLDMSMNILSSSCSGETIKGFSGLVSTPATIGLFLLHIMTTCSGSSGCTASSPFSFLIV